MSAKKLNKLFLCNFFIIFVLPCLVIGDKMVSGNVHNKMARAGVMIAGGLLCSGIGFSTYQNYELVFQTKSHVEWDAPSLDKPLVDLVDPETKQYATPDKSQPGRPVKYIAPVSKLSRKSLKGAHPDRDVQTLETFSCSDPQTEPTGIDKGSRPMSEENITRVATRTNPAFEMACYDHSNDIVCRVLKSNGIWEHDLTNGLEFAKNLVSQERRPFPATNVVDIGANVGYFGLLAAAQGHRVYMFEPFSWNRALVRTSMCYNPAIGNRVMLFPYGGGEHAICRLYSDIGNVGDGHTTCNESFPIPYRYEERGKIQLVPMDDVIGPKEHLFYWKIDVEGYELDVMRTAKSILREGRVAFLTSEISVRMMGGRERVEEYIQLLWDANFEVHLESFYGDVLLSVDDLSVIPDQGERNLYCIHKTWVALAEQPSASFNDLYPEEEVDFISRRRFLSYALHNNTGHDFSGYEVNITVRV